MLVSATCSKRLFAIAEPLTKSPFGVAVNILPPDGSIFTLPNTVQGFDSVPVPDSTKSRVFVSTTFNEMHPAISLHSTYSPDELSCNRLLILGSSLTLEESS